MLLAFAFALDLLLLVLLVAVVLFVVEGAVVGACANINPAAIKLNIAIFMDAFLFWSWFLHDYILNVAQVRKASRKNLLIYWMQR